MFGRIFSRWRATLLVGATPSLVRAAIMGSLSLIAGQIGRRWSAVNTLALGPSARLTVVAASAEGSALRLTWQKFQVLIPGGIPPERLPLDKLRGPALLILAERDLAETSLEDWQALLPQAVLTTLEEPVAANWINIPPEGWVRVTTDGEQMWIEGEGKVRRKGRNFS